MGCNCNKGGANSEYRFTDTAGNTQTVRTEIEAKALKARRGGSYVQVRK